jgi:putative ABC transport system permease protein
MVIGKVFTEAFRMSFYELWNNKLRSLLSILGISIGIICVITVLAAVDSLERNFKNSINKLGDNVIYFSKWPWTFGPNYEWWEYLKRKNPDINEMKFIQKNVQSAEFVALESSQMATEVSCEGIAYAGIEVNGITDDYDKIRELNIIEGRYFTEFEQNNAANVCILGNDIIEKLFEGKSTAIGKIVKFKGSKLKVIGILGKEGRNFVGASFDRNLLIPYFTFGKYYNTRNIDGMNCLIKVKNAFSINYLIDELTGNIRAIRRLKPKADDDFALNQISLLSKITQSLFSSLNIGGWIIGGFAIVVGCFGVANIMFVSVKERTNIIGIKKSLGAKRIVILIEFLLESVLLCIAGGIIGLIIVYFLIKMANNMSDFGLVLSQKNIIIGLFTSTVAGIIAGIVPAFNASKLHPVDAIRSK